MSANSARNRSFIAARVSSSGWRRSTVKKTLPGIVLREFGLESTKPTVAQALGGKAWPSRLTASIMRAAATSASLRSGIGVGPAWASCPVTVISYQCWPWAPVTTPMVFSSFSRDRALLDMGLEIGADLAAADRGRTVVTGRA